MVAHVNIHNRTAASQEIAISGMSVINLRRDLSGMTVPQNKAELKGRFRYIGYVMTEALVAAQQEVVDYGNLLRTNLPPASDYRSSRLGEMEVLLHRDNFEYETTRQIHAEVTEKSDMTLKKYLSTKNSFKAAIMRLTNGGYRRIFANELMRGQEDFVRDNHQDLRDNNPVALMRLMGVEVREDADSFSMVIR